MNNSFSYFSFLSLMIFASISFAQVPSSVESIEAINRVRPQIELELKTKELKYGSEIFIRIFKESKELEVWMKRVDIFEKFKTYKICTYGSDVLGPKIKKGDGKAPEGFYVVDPKSMNPFSNYHLAFNLGYPNEYDRAHKRTGSALMVHGNCVSIGCFAMTDSGIEEIYAIADGALRAGQQFFNVHIFPFPLTDENIKKYRKSRWLAFWKNLKEGYDYFEGKHIPPNVKLRKQKYIFG